MRVRGREREKERVREAGSVSTTPTHIMGIIKPESVFFLGHIAYVRWPTTNINTDHKQQQQQHKDSLRAITMRQTVRQVPPTHSHTLTHTHTFTQWQTAKRTLPSEALTSVVCANCLSLSVSLSPTPTLYLWLQNWKFTMRIWRSHI